MNSNCLILLLVSVGAVVSAPVSAPAVNYEQVAKEIFGNFPIGPVDVGNVGLNFGMFRFQGQEYELKIKDAVLRRVQSARLHPLGVTNGHALKTPGQHSMAIRLILGTLTMDSTLMYKKKGSSEAPKEMKLMSVTVPDHRFMTGINTVISFDVNERKVLGTGKVWTLVTPYDTRSSCQDEASDFCQAVREYVDSWFSYGIVAQQLGIQVEKLLTARKY